MGWKGELDICLFFSLLKSSVIGPSCIIPILQTVELKHGDVNK